MQHILIGRDASNQVVLQDNYVSRKHAELIVMDNGQVLIKDLDSSNGTFVNGNKIKEAFLRAGDLVKCGGAILNWQQYVRPVSASQGQQRTYQTQPPVQAVPQPQYQVQSQVQAQPPVQYHSEPVQQQAPQPLPSGYGQQNIVIIGKQKSVGTAFLLAFLFGPLGLCYATVLGGVVMFVIGILSWFILPILGYFLFVTPVCVIWAIIAANSANSNMLNRAAPLIQNN